jgi:hypothetical protein
MQEMKDRVQSINCIYEKQVMDGVAITDLIPLNTEKGGTCLTVDIFLDHTVHQKALGKLTAAEREKNGTTLIMLRQYGGARLSAGLVAAP